MDRPGHGRRAGRPADPATAKQVRAGIGNFVTCINSGDHLRASTLFTAHFVHDFMGQRSYHDVPLVLGGLTMRHARIGEVLVYEDGSFSTEGSYLAYGHKLAHERWYWWLDRGDGFLKVNKLRPLESPVPRHAAVLNVEMGEYYFRLDKSTFCVPNGRLVLRLTNVGQERHEAIVLQLPPGARVEDMFNGVLTPDQVVTIGQDNGAEVMSLVRMRPGTYTLVDFIPAPDGRPHALHGQTAQFTISPRC